MTIEHSSIPEAGLHEPKGVSASSVDKVYHSDGAGSGNWKYPLVEGQASSTALELPFSVGSGVVDFRQGKAATNSLLTANSVGDQLPTTVDTPLQVEFGVAQAVAEIDLSAAGAISCLIAGSYDFTTSFRFARTGTVTVAKLLVRGLIDGVQIGPSFSVWLGHADDVQVFSFTATLALTVGEVLTFEILRDSTGNDDGGLVTFSPALAGWADSASADLRVDKVVVV